MKYPFLIVILIASLSSGAIAQLNVAKVSNIEVEVNKHNQAYYKHKMQKDETLFSLSRYYKVALNDLLLINKMRRGDTVPLGAVIIIPIATDKIHTTRQSQGDHWVPMVYTVRPKETLHKISNIYFPQKMEDLIARNDISSFALPLGKKLVIGWWGADKPQQAKKSSFAQKLKERISQRLSEQEKDDATEKQAIEDRIRAKKKLEENDEEMMKELDDLLAEMELAEESEETDTLEVVEREINYRTGLAFWDKAGNDTENLFVMHNSAKPNSYIRLRYPVTGQEVTAQVICPIPKGIYKEDIDLVITPAVATALGALDSRFEIQMDFY